MPDPAFDANWWRSSTIDEKEVGKSRADPLGYLMLITAPLVLWEEYQKKHKHMTDETWFAHVDANFEKGTGKLTLDRALFYEHVGQISRLSTLHDTITDMSHFGLTLIPHKNGVIHKTLDEDGVPCGKRGHFGCELELEFVVLEGIHMK
jgi:hypothetical protein